MPPSAGGSGRRRGIFTFAVADWLPELLGTGKNVPGGQAADRSAPCMGGGIRPVADRRLPGDGGDLRIGKRAGGGDGYRYSEQGFEGGSGKRSGPCDGQFRYISPMGSQGSGGDGGDLPGGGALPPGDGRFAGPSGPVGLCKGVCPCGKPGGPHGKGMV